MHVVMPTRAILVIVVDQGTADVKQSDHLVNVIVHDQRMYLARRFKNVHALSGDPIMLQITPLAFDDIAVDRCRVTMPAEYAGPTNSQQIHPFTIDAVQQQRSKPNILRLRYPKSFVCGNRGHHEIGDAATWWSGRGSCWSA